MTSPQAIREAILKAPFELDNKGEKPHPGTLYIPRSHHKVFARHNALVVGARGAGKSFWTAALSDEGLLQQVGKTIPELAGTRTHVGYATKPNRMAYPERDTFKALMDDDGLEPYVVWRAVVMRWLSEIVGIEIPIKSWADTAKWVKQNPEQFAQIAEAANLKLAGMNQFGLVIFDALDRTSHDWKTMNLIVRDLLQVALWLRDFSQLGAKVFLRPDQVDRTSTAFVDASKMLATSVNLTWERHDLHAMMWQRLINAEGPHGACLRGLVDAVLSNQASLKQHELVWYLPAEFTTEVPYQRRLFEALAGDKMGKDARRGVPYVWSVSHLADGYGSTSPRSFLAAISGAAEDSSLWYPDYSLALHKESLKRGIQQASKIRVAEVAEDDPWVIGAMQPLGGMNVPCDYESLEQAWLSKFPEGPGSIPSDFFLPPQHVDSWKGVQEDLVRLGIFVKRSDKRIDMPDLYRVGFGLGRKGGVAPRK